MEGETKVLDLINGDDIARSQGITNNGSRLPILEAGEVESVIEGLSSKTNTKASCISSAQDSQTTGVDWDATTEIYIGEKPRSDIDVLEYNCSEGRDRDDTVSEDFVLEINTQRAEAYTEVNTNQDKMEKKPILDSAQHNAINVIEYHTEGKGCSYDEGGETLNHTGSSERHLTSYTEAELYTCEDCGESFNQASHLDDHRLLHSEMGTCDCNDCRNLFDLPGYPTHTGQKDCSCEKCCSQGAVAYPKIDEKQNKIEESPILNDTQDKSISVIESHDHPITEEKGRSYSKGEGTLNHRERHQTSDPDVWPYNYENCGVSLNQASRLKSHEFPHSEVETCNCDECRNVHNPPGNVGHTDQKDCACENCRSQGAYPKIIGEQNKTKETSVPDRTQHQTINENQNKIAERSILDRTQHQTINGKQNKIEERSILDRTQHQTINGKQNKIEERSILDRTQHQTNGKQNKIEERSILDKTQHQTINGKQNKTKERSILDRTQHQTINGKQNKIEERSILDRTQHQTINGKQNKIEERSILDRTQHQTINGKQNKIEEISILDRTQHQTISGKQNKIEERSILGRTQHQTINGKQNKIEERSIPDRTHHQTINGKQNKIEERSILDRTQHNTINLIDSCENLHTEGRGCSFNGGQQEINRCSSRQRHQTSHARVEPDASENSGESFRQASHLDDHQLLSEMETCNCDECRKLFNLPGYLTHTGQEDCSCEKCRSQGTEACPSINGKRDKIEERSILDRTQHNTINLIDSRENLHTERRGCSFNWGQQEINRCSSRQRHQTSHAGVEPDASENSGESFRQASHLNDHQLLSEMETCNCDECKKLFNLPGYLTHTGQEDCSCEKCRSQGTEACLNINGNRDKIEERSVLKRTQHKTINLIESRKNVHTEGRDCSFNGGQQEIYRCSSLQRNQSHAGVESDASENSGESFKQASHLNHHQLLQSGMDTCNCDECRKLFNLPGCLTHTGQEDCSCEKCRSQGTEACPNINGKQDKIEERSVLDRTQHKTINLIESRKNVHTEGRDCSFNGGQLEINRCSSRQRHQTSHAGIEPDASENSGESFRQASHLNDHQLLQSEMDTCNCDECKKLFNLPGYLTHTGQEDCSCEKCRSQGTEACPNINGKQDKIEERSVLDRTQHEDVNLIESHRNPHTEEKGCSLSDSREVSNHTRPCERHQTNHQRVEPYACEKCGETFNQASLLKDHQLSHLEMDTCDCDNCKSLFNPLGYLTYPGQEGCTCEKCIKSFAKSVPSKKRPSKRTYTCEDCGESFKQLCHLKNHLHLHSEKHTYKCDHCGKLYTSSPPLKRHLLTHTSTKVMTCEQCGKSFTHASHFKEHVRTHKASDKDYTCEECGKICSNSSQFKRHLIFHRRRKDYTCKECGESFGSERYFDKHRRTHAVKCDQCGKSFKNVTSFTQHLIDHE